MRKVSVLRCGHCPPHLVTVYELVTGKPRGIGVLCKRCRHYRPGLALA